MEFSTKDTAFIRAWKRRFGHCAGDWTTNKVNEGTSSFLDFQALITRTDTRILEEAIDIVPWDGRGGLPTFYEFRRAVRVVSGEDQSARGVRCVNCDGNYVVPVVCVYANGAAYAVDPRLTAGPRPTAFLNTMICRCHPRSMTPRCRVPDRAWQRRVTWAAAESALQAVLSGGLAPVPVEIDPDAAEWAEETVRRGSEAIAEAEARNAEPEHEEPF